MSHAEKTTALITGPMGNLGRSVVDAFLQAGKHLILVDRHKDRILREFPDLASAGHILIPGIDLALPQAGDQLSRELKAVERIDYLIHTVGGFEMGEEAHQISDESWERMMRLNVHTFRHVIRPVLPRMAAQGNGRIITIGARPALKGKARMGAYSAAKTVLLRLTETISDEYSSGDIHTYFIVPGTIDTPQNRAAMPNADQSKWIAPDKLAQKIYNVCISEPPEKDTIIPYYS